MHGGLAGKRAFYTVMPTTKGRRPHVRFAALATVFNAAGVPADVASVTPLV